MTKLYRFTISNGEQFQMSYRQKQFCDSYLKSKGDSIGAVITAGYNIEKNGGPDRRLASSIASENLTKPNICAYLNLKLKESGLDDEFVDKQLLFLINQYSDLRVKLSAVDTYYKLKGKYAPKKVDINSQRSDLKEMSDEELKRLAFGDDYDRFVEFKSKTKN